MNARQSRHKRPEQAPSINRKRDPPPPEETAQKKHKKSKPTEEPHGLHESSGKESVDRNADRSKTPYTPRSEITKEPDPVPTTSAPER